MFYENYKWNYDYVRLAGDSGFSFDKHKADDFDKNKISLIDIDRLVREKDVATVEKLIPLVAQFILDPEQAQILDDNFVKIFRLGQLSIDYLQFCKKYLDNSLESVKEDFLKLQEENKELNLFVKDLKDHISVLMKEINEKNKVTTHKCELCNKIFSSDEFLNSHIKRRHSTTNNPPLEVETDKLYLEIKELKGRLNSAEKMIQRDQTNIKANLDNKTESEVKKIDELQQKFEELRLQVQSELKVLQTQHNFQEKYEKLFEKLALQNARGHVDKGGGGDLVRRRESTTQTDGDLSPQKASMSNIPKTDGNKENIPQVEISKKQIISEFGEALETKVTSSLQKIETQMQSFWNKLNEMEIHRTSASQEVMENVIPPAVKPRSKFTASTPPNRDRKVEELKTEEVQKINSKPLGKSKNEHSSQQIRDLELKNKDEEKMKKRKSQKEDKPQELRHQKDTVKPAAVKRTEITSQLSVQDELTDEALLSSKSSSGSEISIEAPVQSRSRPVFARKKQLLSNNNSAKKLVVDDELFQYFKGEVEKTLIMERLQDLGVSPEWKGLPTRSFQRALEIVHHQASLMKKTYPNFAIISNQLEKEVANRLNDIMTNSTKLKKVTKEKSKNEAKKINIVSKKGPVASPQIEIKNRKMYESDSDSEVVKPGKIPKSLKEFSEPYSAVIEELKAVTTKVEGSDNSSKDEEIVKIEDQTKGVLKNYPSVGSLTKKKVLFNLNNETMVPNKGGGSTTSVASSVFDGTPRNKDDEKVDKDKDIEDLSDFDFSEM